MVARDHRIAVLYEHPEWFKPLFAELERRGVAYERWHAQSHRFDPAARDLPLSLVVNRMSPSAYLRGHGNGIFYTRQLLAYLRDIGVPVINPYEAYMVETSKVLQLEIFEQLGAPYPRTRVINHASQAPAAAEGLVFPVVVKPNVGGSGAKIQRFDAPGDLEKSAHSGAIELGFDGTALVQEYLPAAGGDIVRVEVLNGEFLYAIRIHTPQNGNFNLCPADICQDEKGAEEPGGQDLGLCPAEDATKRRLHIESVRPPQAVVDTVLRIARRARLHVGGIEYLVSERDGRAYFYDVNALSNFVTDAERIVGFNPHARFVDFVLEHALQPV